MLYIDGQPADIQLGASVEALLFVIELTGLGGRQKLHPVPVEALLSYEVEE